MASYLSEKSFNNLYLMCIHKNSPGNKNYPVKTENKMKMFARKELSRIIHKSHIL